MWYFHLLEDNKLSILYNECIESSKEIWSVSHKATINFNKLYECQMSYSEAPWKLSYCNDLEISVAQRYIILYFNLQLHRTIYLYLVLNSRSIDGDLKISRSTLMNVKVSSIIHSLGVLSLFHIIGGSNLLLLFWTVKRGWHTETSGLYLVERYINCMELLYPMSFLNSYNNHFLNMSLSHSTVTYHNYFF